jgi:hypothetical protein
MMIELPGPEATLYARVSEIIAIESHGFIA